MNENRHLNIKCESEWEKLLGDENYQKKITKELTNIYINHMKFLKYNRTLNASPAGKIVGALLMAIGLACFLLGIMSFFAFNLLDLFIYNMNENRHLNIKCESEWEKLLGDENYQKKITKELTNIYINHMKFLKYNRTLNASPAGKIVGALLMAIGLACFLLGIMSFFAFNLVEGITLGVVALSGISINSVMIFTTGQLMEDQYDLIRTVLNNMSWYTWNKKNLKIYLLLCTQSLKPVQSLYGFNSALNFESLLVYFKVYYALFMFILQTNLKDIFQARF